MPSAELNHSVSKFYFAARRRVPGIIYQFGSTTGSWKKGSLRNEAGVVDSAYTQRAEEWFGEFVQQPVARTRSD